MNTLRKMNSEGDKLTSRIDVKGGVRCIKLVTLNNYLM